MCPLASLMGGHFFCKEFKVFTIPTVDDFKAYFVRDFPYGSDPDENVLDSDIQKALDKVPYNINESLFCDQNEFNIAFLNLAAHYMCLSIQASSQGLSGKWEFLLSSKSVGSVSVSQTVPDNIANNPQYAYFSKTNYGMEYLVMIIPKLIGSMFIVDGATTA